MLKKFIKQLQESGATVEKVPGENLYSVSGIYYGDDAWNVYKSWGEKIGSSPKVSCGFFPPGDTELVPSYTLGGAIQREANSIVHFYATANRTDVIRDPLQPRMYVPIPTVIALSKLIETIIQPPNTYPTLANLSSGSYICTINHQWNNVGVEIILMKS